jgi:hypothetical protein
MMNEHNSKVTTNEINKSGSTVRGNFLLKYAILAPSCLNTQPWRFEARPDEIRIFGDLKEWREVADTDQRELYISIGCALENILIAAEHFGYGHQVSYLEDEQVAAVIKLNPGGKPSSFRDTELFKAIPERRTIRKIYENRILPPEATKCLEELCIEEGFALHLADDIEIKRKAKELVYKAYAIQLSNNALEKELGYRLAGGTEGKNRPISKIGQIIANCLNMSKNGAKRDSDILMSAPILAAITSENNGHRSQIVAGQILERIWLKANALGISLRPMSCILQVPELRENVLDFLPVSNVCLQQTFMLGYARTDEKRASRRPLNEFII